MIIKLGNLEPKVSEKAWVAPNAALVGDVEVGKDSSIWYSATIRGDVSKITIGEGTSIQDNAVIHVEKNHPAYIGNGSTIGHTAILHGCTIGDNVVIGMGAIVLNGAKIGDNCVIGAGSLVTENKEIPANSMAFGSPAKVVRQVSQEEIETNRENALNYVGKIETFKNKTEILD